jgi:hypothetical protein
MSEHLGTEHDKAAQTARLKTIIDKLAAGASPAAVKKEFHELIKDADAVEVATMEQSLIEGGLPVEEVQRLCEVHADVFKAGLERGEKSERMPGHPVHTYLAENKTARKLSRNLVFASFFGGIDAIRNAATSLRPIITHYARKENQLFPYLERSGFTGPSKVMWGKHDEIRTVFRELDTALEQGDAPVSRRKARDLGRRIRMMIFMEEKILFPNALKRLSEGDWAAVRRGEDAIGFAWVKPGAQWDPALVAPATASTSVAGEAGKQTSGSQAAPSAGDRYANLNTAMAAATAKATTQTTHPTQAAEAMQTNQATPDAQQNLPGQPVAVDATTMLPLSTGSLPLDYLDRILRSLPVDISFVDANDQVMYYSDSPHRFFPRSPAIIGRSVQNCHPHKSVATVEKILEAFKNKEKDKADFWIQMNGRFIIISYKPIYDDNGVYLGTLEMSWDATDIRALEGQRRLLDW